jgi:succinate-acetate transporter protein
MSTVEQPVSSPANGAHTPPEAAAAPTGFAAGDPAILGLPIFVVGSVALALQLVGYVSPAAGGSPIAIIFAGTGLGLVIATIWAAALGQTLVACIFGLFAGFWLSYSVLVIGLNHNWYAIPAGDVQHSVALFQISWAVIMALLAVGTFRLPVAFTAVVGLVVLALVLLIVGTLDTNETFTKLAGYVCFAFAALGGYLFLGAASVATGGKAYELGRPISG